MPVTVDAVAVNVTVVDPADTVTFAGTVRALLSAEIATGVPAVGADDNVTIQFELAPETTVVGEHCKDCNVTEGAPLLSAGVFMSV